MHYLMYQRLKERPIHAIATEARSAHKRKRKGKRWVMIVTGIRGDESQIRTGYKRALSEDESHSLVWVNPFYWASSDDFRDYRKAHELPTNPVCLTLGFSGECLCGAHAKGAGELIRIRMVEPETADYIEALEAKAADAGFPWGYSDNGPPPWFMDAKRGQAFFDFYQTACGKSAGPKSMPMCHNCEKVDRDPVGIGETSNA